MDTWNVSLAATLNRPVAQTDALALGRRIAGERLVMVAVNGPRFGLTAALLDSDDPHDAFELLAGYRDDMQYQLAAAGHEIVAWEAFEALTTSEVDRRLESSARPEVVNVAEFAALCGVAPQRIYDLETERRAAADRGEAHPFPTPLAKGVWFKAAAERYAATRKTKRGPAPGRREQPE